MYLTASVGQSLLWHTKRLIYRPSSFGVLARKIREIQPICELIVQQTATPARQWWSDINYDGQPECRAAINISADFPKHSFGDVNIRATEPNTTAKALASMDEKEIVSPLLYSKTIFHGFFEPIYSYYGPMWVAIELTPRDIGIHHWNRKPGDVDFLFGPIVNGKPSFGWFLGAEMKVNRARPDGEGRRPKGGREQAAGLLDFGCDQAILVQLVVGEQTQENALMPDGTGFGTIFGADLSRAATGWVRQTLLDLPRSIGLMLCMWGHPYQNSAVARSVVFTYAIRRPGSNYNRLHLEWQIANNRLRQGLINIWNKMPDGTRAVRRCPRGGHIVPVLGSTCERCSECGKSWLSGIVIPNAENIHVLPPH
jgi:hypothetical protein